MQVGMMATSNTQALQLPLLRPAQVCFATSCQILLLSVCHHMMHDGTTASLSLASEQPVPKFLHLTVVCTSSQCAAS